MFANEHWRSTRAADEIEIYCDLLDDLQTRIDALPVRGKDEEVTLRNVQAVNSSYALEVAIKSLWALDHPDKEVPRKHDLLARFDELDAETITALESLRWTREAIQLCPEPFVSNRYSMESSERVITVYPSKYLRPLGQLIRDKMEETREYLLKPLRTSSP